MEMRRPRPLEHIVGTGKHELEGKWPMSQCDRFCPVKLTPAVPKPDGILTLSLPLRFRLCELRDAVWKDDGSL